MSEKLLGRVNAPINIPFPTAGGRQLWADIRVADGWRVQTNVLTGFSRLLDRNDIRRAWGSRDHCIDSLPRCKCPASDGGQGNHLLVLVHGLGRSRHSLSRLATTIRRAGFDACAVNYPSLFGGIDTHAEQLNRVLQHANGYRSVSFVTHSLGALIVRQLLGQRRSWQERLQVHGVVMIAPPNRGSALAEALGRHLPFRLVAGQSGSDANISNASTALPLDVPYLVIAGGTRDGRGYNPFLDADDDGIVRVEETRLSDSDSIVKVDTCHTVISGNAMTIAAVVGFLEQGLTAARPDRGRVQEGRPAK